MKKGAKKQPIFNSANGDEKDYIGFGDVSRGKLGLQCQYGSRYVDGVLEGWPCLGYDLRFLGSTNSYHSLKIHKDDVQIFVDRHAKYIEKTLKSVRKI